MRLLGQNLAAKGSKAFKTVFAPRKQNVPAGNALVQDRATGTNWLSKRSGKSFYNLCDEDGGVNKVHDAINLGAPLHRYLAGYPGYPGYPSGTGLGVRRQNHSRVSGYPGTLSNCGWSKGMSFPTVSPAGMVPSRRDLLATSEIARDPNEIATVLCLRYNCSTQECSVVNSYDVFWSSAMFGSKA
eukprot:3937705-Rhodomonas_salina.1